MADVSNPFNPDYERKHEETYLNYSRGADAPQARKGKINKINDNSVANAAQFFNTAVEVKDQHFKARIREEATAEVDAVRDAWIGASAEAGAPTSANVPVDLRAMGRRLSAVTESYRSNGLNDRHYWALMENISRSMRSRYPGYREYIDNVISDVTGGTPANVLQRSIQAAANEADPATKRLTKLQDDLASDSDGIPIPDDETWNNHDRLIRYYNAAKVAKGDIKRREDKLRLADAENKFDEREASQTLRDRVNMEMGFKLKPDIDAFKAQVNDLLRSGKTPSPEVVQALGQKGAAIKAEWLNLFDQISMDPAYNRLPQEVRDKERAWIEEMGNDLTAALQSGGAGWNVVKSTADRLELYTQGEAGNLAANAPSVLTASAISKLVGPEFAIRWAFDLNEGKGLNINTMDSQIVQHHLMRSMETDKEGKTPLVQSVDAIANSSATDKKQAMNIMINKSLQALVDPEATPYAKERALLNMFGEGNKDFLQFFSPKDNKDPNKDQGTTRIGLFRRLTSPAVTKAIVELRDSSERGQELWNNYMSWRDYSFNALMKTTMNTMAKIPTDDQTLNIKFDEATGKIITEELKSSNPTWDVPASWIAGSRKAVNEYNSIVDAMTPGWEAAGLNPAEESRKLVEQASINFDAPKGKNLVTQFWDAVHERAEASESKVTKTGGRESLQKNLGLRKPDGSYRLGRTGEEGGAGPSPELQEFFRQNRPEIVRVGQEIEKMELDGTYLTEPDKYNNLLIDLQILTTPGAEQGRSNLLFSANARESNNIDDRRSQDFQEPEMLPQLFEMFKQWVAEQMGGGSGLPKGSGGPLPGPEDNNKKKEKN